jgi:osmotically-inducible protein OsmY
MRSRGTLVAWACILMTPCLAAVVSAAAGGGKPAPGVDASEMREEPPAWAGHAARVAMALDREPVLADDPIQVSASGLLVTLQGRVDSRFEKRRALELARQTAEPQMIVRNYLTISDPGGPGGRTPEPGAVEDALQRRLTKIPGVHVSVTGEGRRLRAVLSGELPSARARRRVLAVVRQARGLSELEDRTSVRSGRRGASAR